MKNILIITAILTAVALGYFIVTNNELSKENSSAIYTSEVYTFTSPEGQFTVQYNDNNDIAQLTYDDIQYELKNVVSTSGAKYENEDGSVLFWEHQGEAIFEIDRTPVFTKPAQLACNEVDQDCTGPDGQVAKPGDPIPGIDITKAQESTETAHEATHAVQQGKGPGHLDEDSDGDGLGDIDETDRVIMEEGIKNELASHSWLWKGTINSDGLIENEPQKASAFILAFMKDGQFSATTDCNNAIGSYILDGENLAFSQIATTKMACPDDTQEAQFVSMLGEVIKITLTNEGQASLKLHIPSGAMQFVAVPADTALNHDKIIGMSEAEAVAYAEEKDVPFRVVKRDDEYLPTTADYRPGRINAEVEDGIVTKYNIEI